MIKKSTGLQLILTFLSITHRIVLMDSLKWMSPLFRLVSPKKMKMNSKRAITGATLGHLPMDLEPISHGVQ
jgi:hypothetical protein